MKSASQAGLRYSTLQIIDVTGQSVSGNFRAVAFTVNQLTRLVPTLGVTGRASRVNSCDREPGGTKTVGSKQPVLVTTDLVELIKND